MATKVFSATLDNLRTLSDRSVKITLTTQEISGEEVGQLFNFQGQFVKVAVTDENIIKASVLKDLEAVDMEVPDKDKSPAKRLKSVLFRIWEKNSEGYEDFELFYRRKLEIIIDHFKEKLDR